MTLVGRLHDIVEPVVTALGVELVDLEHAGGTVRVVVDEDGGIGTERLGEVTLAVSRALDEHDPLPGRYTLEVSSPGVERPLRTPRHFERARGLKVSLRAREDDGSFRRLVGIIVGSDDEAVSLRAEPERAGGEVTFERVPYDAIDRARTIFEWGPAPKPGKGSKPGAAKKRAAGEGTASADAGRGQAGTGKPQVATSPGTPGTRPGGNR